MFTHKQMTNSTRKRPLTHAPQACGRREPSPEMLARIVSFLPNGAARIVQRISRAWQQEQNEHITETTRYGKRVTTRRTVTTVYETETTYTD